MHARTVLALLVFAPVALGQLPPDELTVTTLVVGRSPIKAEIAPNERTAYALSWGANEVAVISLDLLSVVDTIDTAAFTTDMLLSSDGAKLYLANYDTFPSPFPEDDCFAIGVSVSTARLGVLDTDTLSFTSIPLGSRLINRLLFSDDGASIAAFTEDAVYIVDLDTLSISATTSHGAYFGAFCGEGRVFASSTQEASLLSIDTANGNFHAVDISGSGYAFELFGNVECESDRVFATVKNLATFTLETAILDANSEGLLEVLPISLLGGMAVNASVTHAFTPWNGGITDLITLQVIGNFTGGTSGILSADEELLYLQRNGGVVGAIVVHGSPKTYQLRVREPFTNVLRASVTLDPEMFLCTYGTPLATSESRRYIISPNSATDSVSIVRIGSSLIFSDGFESGDTSAWN